MRQFASLFLLCFSSCITYSMPWNRVGHSPRVLSGRAMSGDFVLVYEQKAPLRFGPAERKPFAAPARSMGEARSFAASRSAESQQSLLHAITRTETNGSLSAVVVYSEPAGNGLELLFLSEGTAAQLAREEEEESASRIGPGGELREARAVPARQAIEREVNAGRIPAGVEVVVIPQVMDRSALEIAENTGIVCLMPFAVVLDVVTFPVQFVWFIASGQKIWLGGIPR